MAVDQPPDLYADYSKYYYAFVGHKSSDISFYLEYAR